MTILLAIAFLVWLTSAGLVALDVALPKTQAVRIRANNYRRR